MGRGTLKLEDTKDKLTRSPADRLKHINIKRQPLPPRYFRKGHGRRHITDKYPKANPKPVVDEGLQVHAQTHIAGHKLDSMRSLIERRILGNILSLSSSGYTSVQSGALSACLQTNPQVNTLVLRDCNLKSGCSSLLDVLTEAMCIEHLDLARTFIDASSLAKLLDLLNTDSVQGFFGCSIEELKQDGLRHFYLTTLNLSNNRLGDRGGQLLAASLVTNEQLESLDISHCAIKGAGGAALGNALGTNDCLTELNLSWNQLGDVNCMTAMADGLATNEQLKKLDLSRSGMHCAACAALVAGLQKNKALRYVDLSGNSLGLATAKTISKALKHLSLESLVMRHNPLSFQACEQLMQALGRLLNWDRPDTHLKQLDIMHCTMHAEAILPEDGECKNEYDPFMSRPDGWYRLQLEVPGERESAAKLLDVRHRYGGHTWTYSFLRRKPIKVADFMNWPDHMPKKGELHVKLKSPAKLQDGGQAVPDGLFAHLWLPEELVQADRRLAYIKIMTEGLWFTCAQAEEMIGSFLSSRDKVTAATYLAGRLIDVDYDTFRHALTKQEWEDVILRLAPSLHLLEANATNRFSLDLSQSVDRIIFTMIMDVTKSIMTSYKYGRLPDQEKLLKLIWRNVSVNGTKLAHEVNPLDYRILPTQPKRVELTLVHENALAVAAPDDSGLADHVLEVIVAEIKKKHTSLPIFKEFLSKALDARAKAAAEAGKSQSQPEPPAAEKKPADPKKDEGLVLSDNQRCTLFSFLRWLSVQNVFEASDVRTLLKKCKFANIHDAVHIALIFFSRLRRQADFPVIMHDFEKEQQLEMLECLGYNRIIQFGMKGAGLHFDLDLKIHDHYVVLRKLIRTALYLKHAGAQGSSFNNLEINGLPTEVKENAQLHYNITGVLPHSNKTPTNRVSFFFRSPDHANTRTFYATKLQNAWRMYINRKHFILMKIAAMKIKVQWVTKLVVWSHRARKKILMEHEAQLEAEYKHRLKLMKFQLAGLMFAHTHKTRVVVRSYQDSVIRRTLIASPADSYEGKYKGLDADTQRRKDNAFFTEEGV